MWHKRQTWLACSGNKVKKDVQLSYSDETKGVLMRQERSPFHHVIFFSIYWKLIIAHTVDCPRGPQPIFICFLLLTQICNKFAPWFCSHFRFFFSQMSKSTCTSSSSIFVAKLWFDFRSISSHQKPADLWIVATVISLWEKSTRLCFSICHTQALTSKQTGNQTLAASYMNIWQSISFPLAAV